MEGHVAVPSPPNWAWAFITRLDALATPAGFLTDTLCQPYPSIKKCAWLLTERVVATSCLPPQALGLGACALGLVAAGVLTADEVQPQHLPSATRDGSWLSQ